MRAGPTHDQFARLPWLIAMMTVIVLAIGAFAVWYVENDMAASAPVRSMLWKLAAAWVLVWLPMLGFSLWSARRLKQAWAHVRDERAHAETAESKYRELVEQADDIIYRVDLNGYFTYINSTVTRYKGYTRYELLGRHFTEHIRPDAREAARRFYLRQFARKTPSTYYEFPVIKKDGGEIWFGQNVHLLIENDQPVGFQAVARDITERKRAEEALRSTTEFLQTLIQTSPLAIIHLDPDSNVVSWNGAAENMLGWSESEVLGKPLPYIPPDKQAEADMVWDRAMRGSGLNGVEIRRVRKDGKPIDLEVWSRTIRDAQGTPTSSIGILADITERKRAEEALRESEKRFRTIFDQAPLGITVIESASGRFMRINREFCDITGYRHEDLLALTFMDITHPDDLQADLDNMAQLIEGRSRSFKMEKRYIRKDKSIVWVNLTCVPLWLEDEKDRRFHIAMVEDITERKEVEAEIQRARTFLDSIVENIPDMIFVKDAADLRFARFNKAGEDLLGHRRQDLIGKTDYDIFPKAEADFFTAKDRAALESKHLLDIPEEPIDTTHRGRRILHTKKIPIFDETGAPQYLLGISEDITERKRAEEALRESEHRYKMLFNHASDAVFLISAEGDEAGRILAANQAAAEMHGYTIEELLAMRITDLDTPTAAAEAPDRIRELLTGKRLIFEIEHRRKDGTIFPIEATACIFVLDNRRCILAFDRDISDRKRAEEALRESKERFSKSFSEAPIGMAMVAVDGRWLQVNRALCQIVGYSEHELLAANFQAITHPLDLEDDLTLVRQMLNGEIKTYQIEKRYMHKLGHIVWILLSVSLVHDAQGRPSYFISQIQDITERKQTDIVREQLVKELAESKDRFEMFFRQTPSAIAITTIKDGRFLDVNTQAEILTGYSREELIGHTTVEMNLYVDSTERASVVQALKTKGILTDLEREIRTKSGEIRTAVFSLVPIMMGSEPCMLSIAHDITDRKRAEEGLRERSRQQAVEAELSLLAVTVQDLPTILQTAVDLIANALDVNYCEVLERLPRGTQLRLCASAGWRGDRLGQVREAERGSLAHAAMHTNRPVVSQGFQADGRVNGPPWLGAQGVVSGLGVAIRSQEESWGALGVYRAGTRAFSRDDANFIQTISNILAAAIERKQAETVLQNANRALRTLSRQLLQVQEQERRTIARDLHDEIGQSLTAIKLNVERAQRARDSAARVRIMKDSIQITEHVLGQVRDLSLNLHPSILDDLGLAYALKWYADRQAERAGLNVAVVADPSLPRLSPHLELAFFRIAQEALTNVVRHAKASRVDVTIKQGAASVELRVQDDGIGFEVDAVPQPSVGRTSVGLASMQERARLLGGLVRIRSKPGRGTTVIALLPLELTASDEIPETETSRS